MDDGKGQRLYIAPKVFWWTSARVDGNKIETDDGSVGFTPVYDSLEAFWADYPDAEPVLVDWYKKGVQGDGEND
jgi:hypothetical protein